MNFAGGKITQKNIKLAFCIIFSSLHAPCNASAQSFGGNLPSPNWSSYSSVWQPAWFNLNNFPVTSMNGNNNFGTASALTASIDTPSNDTVWNGSINTGVSGYARSASPQKGSVGIYGAGMSNANGTQQWGGNFVATNYQAASGNVAGSINFLSVGMESDLYINGASGLSGEGIGIKIAGAVQSLPSGGLYGIEIAPANVAATVGWVCAICVDDAPNVQAITIGVAGLGSNLPSQAIAFHSRTSGGISLTSNIYEDQGGNIILAPHANVGILSGVTLGTNGVNSGLLSLSNGAAGGALVTLQNAAAAAPYNFYFPANAGAAGSVLTSGGGSASMTWTATGSSGHTLPFLDGNNIWSGSETISGALTVAAGVIVQSASHTPASSSDACSVGEEAWDVNYEYRCVATNTWKRAALSSF